MRWQQVRRRLALFGLSLALVAAAGCAGIPSNGPVHDVRKVADQVSAAAPEAPQPGQLPDQVVRGFISASARTDLDTNKSFSAARQFLTPEEQNTWQTTSVVLLNDGYRTEQDPTRPGTVTVTGIVMGGLNSDGSYSPGAGAAYSLVLHLVQVQGQWRISDPPSTLLIVASDFTTAFQEQTLYFLDATGTIVVPDPRYLPQTANTTKQINQIMYLLLNGPSAALRGAARTQLGGQAELRSNILPTGADDVTHVDLSGVDVSTPAQRRALAAQIVWTLYPYAPKIAITVAGEPVDPTQPVATLNAYSSFDPDRLAGTGAVATDPYYIDTSGRIVSIADGTPMWGRVGTGSVQVESAAMSAATGTLAAVIKSGTDGVELLIGKPLAYQNAEPALAAASLTTPSFTHAGDQVWVVQNGATKPEIYSVSTSGTPSRARVDSSVLKGKGPVTALALSPDGVRVALVVDGQLYTAAIESPPAESGTPEGGTPSGPDNHAPVTLGDLQLLSSTLSNVGPVVFESSTNLLVGAASTQGGTRVLWSIGIDGRDLTAIGQPNRIFGDVDSIAVAPGQKLLIGFSGRIWELNGSTTTGTWEPPDPSVAYLSGGSPFYPN